MCSGSPSSSLPNLLLLLLLPLDSKDNSNWQARYGGWLPHGGVFSWGQWLWTGLYMIQFKEYWLCAPYVIRVVGIVGRREMKRTYGMRSLPWERQWEGERARPWSWAQHWALWCFLCVPTIQDRICHLHLHKPQCAEVKQFVQSHSSGSELGFKLCFCLAPRSVSLHELTLFQMPERTLGGTAVGAEDTTCCQLGGMKGWFRRRSWKEDSGRTFDLHQVLQMQMHFSEERVGVPHFLSSRIFS